MSVTAANGRKVPSSFVLLHVVQRRRWPPSASLYERRQLCAKRRLGAGLGRPHGGEHSHGEAFESSVWHEAPRAAVPRPGNDGGYEAFLGVMNLHLEMFRPLDGTIGIRLLGECLLRRCPDAEFDLDPSRPPAT